MALQISYTQLAKPAPAKPRPILITLHPSAFTQPSPTFEADAGKYARAKGFDVLDFQYPLGNLKNELATTAYAAALAAKKAPTYTYGDSAGGTLAVRLAQKGLVRAAACFSPVVDVWGFLQSTPSVANILGASKADADAASPALFKTLKPIYAIAGKSDHLIPVATVQAWDTKDPLVYGRYVNTCDHLGGGPPNALYESNMRLAIDWLAARAPFQ